MIQGVLSLLLLGRAFAGEFDPEVVDRLKHGVVIVRVPGSQGSGFFVDDDIVLTNAHVVEKAAGVVPVEVVLDSGTPGQEVVGGMVLDLDDEVDLALIRVSPQPGRALKFSAEAPRETDEVVAVGYPAGDARSRDGQGPPVSLRPGSVTAIYRARSGELNMIEHNANMAAGSSGGPLADERGEVRGVNVAELRVDPSTKLAIPAGVVMNYITRASRVTAQRPESSILDIAVGPDATAMFLLRDGMARTMLDGKTVVIGGPFSSIVADEKTGEFYAVSAARGNILHRDDDGWSVVGSGTNRDVAVAGGIVYAVVRSGEVQVLIGRAWKTISQGRSFERVVTCGGETYLGRGDEWWGVDGELRVADGPPTVTAADIACGAGEPYGLSTDGGVFRIRDRLVVGVDYLRLFSAPLGLLAERQPGEFWLWKGGAWVSLKKVG